MEKKWKSTYVPLFECIQYTSKLRYIHAFVFHVFFFFCNAAIFKLASKYASVERGFVMRMQLDFFIFVQGIFESTKEGQKNDKINVAEDSGLSPLDL